MVGRLPQAVVLDGVKYEIRSDFRVGLLIMLMMNDKQMTDDYKFYTLIKTLFVKMPPDNLFEEALRQAIWFLNCGEIKNGSKNHTPKVMDWEQDEQLIFAGITAVAGQDIRNMDFVHWWTFMGYYMSISGDSLFSHVIEIRTKLKRGKKLEKHEQKFYANNKDMIDLTSDKKEIEELLASSD